MINLVNELTNAYKGDAWHGNNTLQLILQANPEKVFTHPIPDAHSIAELVLHLTAWTEEVTDRITGEGAKEPVKGDWPIPAEKSEVEWSIIIDGFKSVNERLIKIVDNLMLADWTKQVKDERNLKTATIITNAQLLNGLIQHHAYHSGQIALLLKF
jgi:uncharacterized damage-inducible protein DinB